MRIRIPGFLLLMTSLAGGLLAADAPKKTAVELPVQVQEDRFWVTPVTPRGQTLRFFTDTGGGLIVFDDAVKRLDLKVQSIGEGMSRIDYLVLPEFRPEASIPPPLGNEGHLNIMRPVRRPGFPTEPMDGMLGQAWFAGRVWTFDYPGKRLLWYPDGELPPHDAKHRATLGFKKDEAGKRAANFPRLTATIDGEALDLLLETGATVTLSDSALKALGDNGPASRATSFIVATIFDRWRQKHPDWRVIENADQGSLEAQPIIQVPAVTIAGHTVGPVWFTRRLDPEYQQFKALWTDRRVEGALGGSALKYFRVTVDYPKAVAVFERP
jgi:hypothetical protein